jgi:phosphoglycolate phosphatase
LFDKDGTLLDFASMWGEWAIQLIHRMKTHDADADWEQAIGIAITNDHAEVDPRGPLAMASNAHFEAILAWHLYRKGYAWNQALQIVDAEVKRTIQALEAARPIRPVKGLLTFLDQCRDAGIPLGVATSDATDMAVLHLDWLGIRDRFAVVIGSDQVAKGKPHPEMAMRACAAMGLDPQDVVMIGDTQADVDMAKNAGMRAVIQICGSPAASRTDMASPDAVISNYLELSLTR